MILRDYELQSRRSITKGEDARRDQKREMRDTPVLVTPSAPLTRRRLRRQRWLYARLKPSHLQRKPTSCSGLFLWQHLPLECTTHRSGSTTPFALLVSIAIQSQSDCRV